jgi:hypothetical protein
MHYPDVHLLGMLGYIRLSDTRHYSVWGFHMSRMRQYIQVLVQSNPTDVGLNRHTQDYHLGAPNIRSDHSPSLPSSILHFPQITLPGL